MARAVVIFGPAGNVHIEGGVMPILHIQSDFTEVVDFTSGTAFSQHESTQQKGYGFVRIRPDVNCWVKGGEDIALVTPEENGSQFCPANEFTDFIIPRGWRVCLCIDDAFTEGGLIWQNPRIFNHSRICRAWTLSQRRRLYRILSHKNLNVQ